MGLHHLQGQVNVALPVRVSVRWPAEVKQHQSATAGSHLQELGQRENGLVLGLGAVGLRQGGHGTKGIPLEERERLRYITFTLQVKGEQTWCFGPYLTQSEQSW